MSNYHELKKRAESSADALESLNLKEEAKSLRLFIAQADADRRRLHNIDMKSRGSFWG